MSVSIKIIFSFAICGLAACVSSVPGDSALKIQPAVEHNVVLTPQGSIRGQTECDVNVYRGVPFAQPPVGSRRWQQPQELEPFTNTFDAKEFGPACPQMALDADAIAVPPPANQSEDCLTLNI